MTDPTDTGTPSATPRSEADRIADLEARLEAARGCLREALTMTGRECDGDLNRLLNFPRKLLPVLRRGLAACEENTPRPG